MPYNNDSRNPTNYTGLVQCLLCGVEYLDTQYHICKKVTDED